MGGMKSYGSVYKYGQYTGSIGKSVCISEGV